MQKDSSSDKENKFVTKYCRDFIILNQNDDSSHENLKKKNYWNVAP